MKRAMVFFCLLAACGDDDAAPGIDAAPEPSGVVRVAETAYAESTSSLVEARFAVRLPRFHRVAAREGACELLVWDNPFCEPACTTGFCVEGNRCEPYAPEPVKVGRVTVTGLATEVDMEPAADGSYYHQGTLPADLFADDADITLRASGDTWPAFTVAGAGVAAIDLAGLEGDKLPFSAEDQVIRWTPGGGAGVRVRLTLNGENLAHGLPLATIIRCEADDAAGQLTVPRALLARFPALHHEGICVRHECPASVLARVRESRARVGDGEVALEVVAERHFFLEYPR